MSTLKQNSKRAGLAALIGGVAAAALFSFTPTQEGTVYKTYKDLGGVLTYCTGATEDAVWGKTYTPQECAAQLDRDLERHALGISRCMPLATLTNGQKVAFVDTAYNIGVAAFCSSSMARLTGAGDMDGACRALLRWVYVKGARVRGLVLRRERVYAFCTKGI